MEQDLLRIKAKADRHIALRKADAIDRGGEFDDEKDGKFSKYVKPEHTRQWAKDYEEGRTIDWVPESEESEQSFECSCDPKEGIIRIRGLNKSRDTQVGLSGSWFTCRQAPYSCRVRRGGVRFRKASAGDPQKADHAS